MNDPDGGVVSFRFIRLAPELKNWRGGPLPTRRFRPYAESRWISFSETHWI